jgi:hypothetical protein
MAMGKFDDSALMERMTAVLEKLGENQKPYEPGFGDPAYQARLKAEGFQDEFPIPVFQNGREAVARGLSQETRERASALKTGSYLGGKVSVEAGPKSVHLRYKSQKIEDRMSQPWRDFPELIDKLWSEMHVA